MHEIPWRATFPIPFHPTATPRADFRRMHFIFEVMLTMLMLPDDVDDVNDMLTRSNLFQ